MKRIGNLYDSICNIENIKSAILNSSKGKRHKPYVKRVLDNIDAAAETVRALLMNKTYRPAPYVRKTILDGPSGKTREICKPKYFPDQVIHWALMLQLQPILMRGMYRYSCGSVPGRGTTDGQKAIRKWLDTDHAGTKYCLKMDVSKFYPSIKGPVLKAKFRRILKDPETLWLIDAIIDSSDGLPIGNFTSQWFANFFLQDLDHYITERLRAGHYIRYVDDLVILGPNKRKLHKARQAIDDHLNRDGLSLKRNWQVFRPSVRAIDFLGLRFYRDRTTLRKRNALRIRRRMRKIAKKRVPTRSDTAAVISYWGWIRRTDSYRFYHTHVKPTMSIQSARRAVSAYARQYARRREQNGKAVRLRPHPGI